MQPTSLTLATPRVTGGLPLRELLEVSALTGHDVLAGKGGLDRIVRRMNVMEVPDILPWVTASEFLVTTAYPLRDDPEQLVELIDQLADRELSGLGVKLGRYLDRLPDAVLSRADARDFPIISLPAHARYDDLLQQGLTRILDHQVSALSVSEQVHHALAQIVLDGGALPEIARDVARVLRRAVLIAEPDGQVLGAAGFTDDQRLEAASAAIAGLDADERSAERVTPVAGGAHLLTVPISAGGRCDGVIGALELDRPLGDDDLAALRSAALVAALVVHQQAAVRSARHKSAADLLHALLSGRIERGSQLVRRAASMGWDLRRPVVVAVIEADRADSDGSRVPTRLVSAVTAAMRTRDRGAGVVPLASEVVVIAGSDVDLGELRGAVADAGVPCTMGVSRVADGPGQVAEAYEQASLAARLERRLPGRDGEGERQRAGGRGSGRLMYFDDLGAFRLLSSVPPDELRAYAIDVLGPLLGDDDDAVTLRRTLRTFLETGGNVAETARRLHFHYNTVRSRLARIEGLVGNLTDQPRRQLDVGLALQITTMSDLGLLRETSS